MKEADFVRIAEFLHRACEIALDVQKSTGKMLKEFVAALHGRDDVKLLKAEVEAFARSFPMPGFDPSSIPESVKALFH